MSTKRNVVILGGGAAGASVAKKLSSSPLFTSGQHTLTLINERPFYAHLIAALRPSVTLDGDFDERLQFPYDSVLGGVAKLVVGRATAIIEHEGKGSGQVELEGGSKIDWDILVIATGNRWEGPSNLPFTKSEIKEHFGGWRSRIGKANNVIIAGGGAVGVG
jgi:apoptosis-inducing factor 2